MTPFQSLTFRSPDIAEAEQTLALMLRCDLSEYGLPDSDLADLLYDWEHIDLSRDAWLALDPGGQVVGYGAMLPWGSNIRYSFYTDPTWEDQTLGQTLLARCEERGQELAKTLKPAGKRVVKIYIPHVNQPNRLIVEQAGFQVVNYVFNMQVDLAEASATPVWPQGITVRPVQPGQDDRAIHQFIQTTFERPGRTPQSFEVWQNSLMRPDVFDPTLWFVAVAEGELVGACLGMAYAEEGWVRQLGVAAAWRRRGLGRALLLHAFVAFKQRGFGRVGLAVEADNPKAIKFYQAVDMTCIRQYDEYEKLL